MVTPEPIEVRQQPESAMMLSWVRGYQLSWLRFDLIAGITVWAILVPESLAYATIAGVPPVVGLYAAVPALLLYALLGSSRHLVVASMSATAVLSAGIVANMAKSGTNEYVALTAALAICTGVAGIVAGLLRMGFLASFISEPVLKGFIVGLALTILVGQLPRLFGIPKGDGDFFQQLGHLIRHLDDTNWRTLVVGVISLAVVLGLHRWWPLIPGALVAVLLGIAAVSIFNLQHKGVAIVGHIDSGLPHLGWPNVPNRHDYLPLTGSAVGVLLVGYAEALGVAKTYAARTGYDIDPNRELLALGTANLGAGLSSGMVVNGGLTKTAVNAGAGAKSQLSGVTVAGLTVLTLLFLTGLFEKLPEATLAAVVIAAVLELIDFAGLRSLYRVWTQHLANIYGWAARADFLAAIAAMLGVLIFDTLPGLVIGIAVSILLLLYRVSRPRIAHLGRSAAWSDWTDLELHPEAAHDPSCLVLRIEGGLFFANADHVRAAIRDSVAEDTQAVVLDAGNAAFIDVTATRMLTQLAQELDRMGISLSIANAIGQTRDVLREAADESASPVRTYPTIDQAVGAAIAGNAPKPRAESSAGEVVE
jgi:high affinity sulfate transporter 1